MIRYPVVLLIAAAHNFSFALSETKLMNELTEFNEITAAIRTDAWIDVKVKDEGKNLSVCISDVATIWQSAAAGHNWALHMLDAESKVQSGILLGNLRNLGMYDQCVEIAAQQNPTNIRSQYCMVSLSIPPRLFSDASSLLLMNKVSALGQSAGSALSFTSAMCLPSSCSENDIFVIVSEIIKQKAGLKDSEIEVAQVICSHPRDIRVTMGEYLFTAFVALTVSFLLYCTACEFLIKRERAGSSLSMKTLAKFSLYKSAVITLSTKMSPDTIPILNGLRILNIIYVIAFHRVMNTAISPTMNPQSFLEWQHKWYATFFVIGSFIIDNFLIISGFLLAHNHLESMGAGKKFNLLESCIHRYLRLTPSIVVIILIAIFYIPRLGSGPVWGFTEEYIVGFCMENWWTNLLYIQNIVHAEHMCLPHLWYIAVEMQLFFAAQILLFALFRWPKYQKSIFISVMVASLILPPILFAVNGYTNAFYKIMAELSVPEMRDNLINAYMCSIQRSFSYLGGIVLAFITVNQKIKLSEVQAKIYWVIACGLMLLCFLATRYVNFESDEYDVAFEVAYSALVRPAWTFAVLWIIYACIHGHGGLLAEFLSAPVFLPLSQISYCTYLVHFMLQILSVTGVQVPVFHSNSTTLQQIWADLLVSSSLGFLLNLFVETPIRILAKSLRNSKPSQASLAQKSSETMSKKDTDKETKKLE